MQVGSTAEDSPLVSLRALAFRVAGLGVSTRDSAFRAAVGSTDARTDG